MITFKNYYNGDPLNERFVNLFKPEDKQQYAQDVWNILQKSYSNIGGIKGSGFSNIQDMIDNIPFWKVAKRDGIIKAVTMYKDKAGRKSVAIGTDGTKEGKALLRDITSNDFERAYGEKSDRLLKFIKHNFPEKVKKHTIDPNQARDILKKDIEPIDDKEYYRTIGKEKIKKRMIGTPGIPIIPK